MYVAKIQESIQLMLPNAKFIAARGGNLDGTAWIARHLEYDAAPPLLRWANADTVLSTEITF